MYREQKSICVYCERSVSETQLPPTIEHWRPLSRDHQHALHWRNLYLSCSTAETCNSAKGDRQLKREDVDPDLPWPTDLAYEGFFGFSRGGEIYVRNDANVDATIKRAIELAINDCLDAGRRRLAILNLNHPALVAARKAALDTERSNLQRDFEDRRASKNERLDRASHMLQQPTVPAYVSIRVAWLRGELGRGR